MSVKVGDTLTIEGVREMLPNPARKWWQFWKPRFVEGAKPARFTIVSEYYFHRQPIRRYGA